ncbi:MAG: glycosyltransferase family 39 protein, partial [Flavobacteriales bacterium]|nr:glycosyltransferase family 39 protein [Flavobacteriales bacterium]
MTQRSFQFAIAGIVLVTVLGAGLDVMEVDAAQYAGMSRDMLSSDDWTKLFFRGNNYLDKPPLLFWLSALSFNLFGVSNWSYKLPSIAFAFLGLFATYRFTLLHAAREVARTAALIFGSSAAFLLMTNDVRCDTILTGSVITAIWAGAAWMEQRRWWQLILCSIAIAAGMLAKGPMG